MWEEQLGESGEKSGCWKVWSGQWEQAVLESHLCWGCASGHALGTEKSAFHPWAQSTSLRHSLRDGWFVCLHHITLKDTKSVFFFRLFNFHHIQKLSRASCVAQAEGTFLLARDCMVHRILKECYVNIQRSVQILNWDTEYVFRLSTITFQPWKNFFFTLTEADCIADLSFPSLMVLPDWLAVKVVIKNFLNIETFFADGFFCVATQRICSKPCNLGAIWISTEAASVLTATETSCSTTHAQEVCLFILSRCQLLPFFVCFGEDTGHDVGGKYNEIISILPLLDSSTTVFLRSVGWLRHLRENNNKVLVLPGKDGSFLK